MVVVEEAVMMAVLSYRDNFFLWRGRGLEWCTAAQSGLLWWRLAGRLSGGLSGSSSSLSSEESQRQVGNWALIKVLTDKYKGKRMIGKRSNRCLCRVCGNFPLFFFILHQPWVQAHSAVAAWVTLTLALQVGSIISASICATLSVPVSDLSSGCSPMEGERKKNGRFPSCRKSAFEGLYLDDSEPRYAERR